MINIWFSLTVSVLFQAVVDENEENYQQATDADQFHPAEFDLVLTNMLQVICLIL